MRGAKPVTTVAILAAIHALAPGCRHVGATDTSDAGKDAGATTDTNSGADLPEGADPSCSSTLDHACYPLPASQLDVELDGETLASGGTWRFVDIGGYHGVLAERDTGDGLKPVVVFPGGTLGAIEFGAIAILPPDIDEEIEPISISEPLPSWDEGETHWLYAVLTRTASGYVVYGVPDDTWIETPPDGYEEPTGFAPLVMQPKLAVDDSDGYDLRGISYGFEDPWGERLCVYGDGVRCTEGSGWSYSVAAGSGLFNDLTFEPIGEAWGLVVGDDGRMVRLLDSGWQVVPTGTESDLHVVFGTSAGYYAAGEHGVYAALPNTAPQPEAAETAQVAETDVVDLFWPLPFDPEAIGGIELSGLTADGCAFDLKGTEIISCFGAHALDGPVIGSTYWTVPMVSSGRFFLTEDRLYRFTIQED